MDAPRQDDGATPLYTAAYGGHTAVVELLPAAKAGVDTPNQNGATPLYVAAQLTASRFTPHKRLHEILPVRNTSVLILSRTKNAVGTGYKNVAYTIVYWHLSRA